MSRNYFLCPICNWQMTWAYTLEKYDHEKDMDIGLVISQHMEKEHPEAIYGDIIPSKVYRKWKKLLTPTPR